jgi:hypothetical protein
LIHITGVGGQAFVSAPTVIDRWRDSICKVVGSIAAIRAYTVTLKLNQWLNLARRYLPAVLVAVAILKQ